ncbi:MAG: site-specific DNA-methyltransferase [Sphingomonas phyllosphaerae]
MNLEALTSALGKPDRAGPGWAIYQGDCVDLLSSLPRGTVPLTVTSPPYNIGKSYEQVRAVDEYLDWCEKWVELIHNATAPGGAFWLNLGYLALPDRAKAIPIPYLLWDRVPFFLIQEVIWNYGAGVSAKRSFSPRNEKFLWYVKDPENYTFNLDDVRDPDVKYPNQRKNGKLRCNPLGKNPSDVWQIPKVTSGRDRSSKERTAHPAQFPTAVVNRIIRASSNPGDVVLDPFLGSGSLAEAAVRAGRTAVGFELNGEYVDMAAARLHAAMAQAALL